MTRPEYLEKFRMFIKDQEWYNRLLNFKEENEDDYLNLYLDMAVAFISSIPPFVYRPTLDDEKFPFFSLIIHQATIECLISNGILQARNDLTYNNGGITVKIDDASRYLSQLQALFKMADREIDMYTKWLIALNIDGGYSGVASPYAYFGVNGRSNYFL